MLAAPAVMVVAAPAAPKSDLVPPEKRRPVVELANKLAKAPESAAAPDATLISPFNRAAKAPVDAARPSVSNTGVARPSGSREILEAVAPRIQSQVRGTFVLGGSPILVVGQKRLKVGETFTITFEGNDYELEITAIERTSFKLRLRDEEITQPITPGKTKP